MNASKFSSLLIKWRSENIRELPWKNTKDPFKIWISEIILQQTRVEQGTPYYKRFIDHFPDIHALARAHEDEVLKLWEGLGYYSRARNIHYTAKIIVNDYKGKFPASYDEIIKMKGIGPYTAAAISSFAFEAPNAVVDGNVLRLVSRLNGIYDDIASIQSQVQVKYFVSEGIKHTKPSEFNQALMDFGSTICKPLNPLCSNCPFQSYCVAYTNEHVDILPFKQKAKAKKYRYFHYFETEFHNSDSIILEQREGNDVWKKLFQLPLIETDSDTKPSNDEILQKFALNGLQAENSIETTDKIFIKTQVLTHQKIVCSFYKVHLSDSPIKINKPQYLVERKKVSNFAFPKMISDYFMLTQN